MEQHQTFGADLTTVATARKFVGTALAGWGLQAEDTCLLTSELVTNAVVHGGTDITVSIKLLDRQIRVEVIDLNPALPRPAEPGTDATSGRGLRLVQGIARAWGTFGTPAQKTVWFEVAAQALASSSPG